MKDQHVMKLLLSRVFVTLALIMVCEGLNRTEVHNKTHVLIANILQNTNAISNNISQANDTLFKNKISLSGKSGSEIANNATCRVKISFLKKLKEGIDLALSNISLSQEYSRCVYKSNSSIGTCKEILKAIRCGDLKLRNKIFAFLAEIENSNERIETLIDDLEGQYGKNEEMIENIKAHLAEKHRKEMEKLENEDSTYSDRLEELHLKFSNDLMLVCASEIMMRRIKIAVDFCISNFKSPPELEEIIKIVFYNYGKLETITNLGIFMESLPHCGYKNTALKVLLDVMTKNKYQREQQILILAAVSQQCSKSSEIRKKLEPLVTHVIEVWGKRICSRNYKNILRLLEGTERRFYKYLIKDIINQYKTESCTDEFIELAETMAYCEDKVITFETLSSQMGHFNPAYFRIGIDLRTILDSSKCTNELKIRLEIIKNKLPDQFVKIIWNGKKCLIKTAEGQYTLEHSYEIIRNSRYVYTNLFHLYAEDDHWKIEFVSGSGFMIRAESKQEYLYADYENRKYFRCGRRAVYLFLNGEIRKESYWKLEAIDTNKFAIKNAEFNEYLTDKKVPLAMHHLFFGPDCSFNKVRPYAVYITPKRYGWTIKC